MLALPTFNLDEHLSPERDILNDEKVCLQLVHFVSFAASFMIVSKGLSLSVYFIHLLVLLVYC